MSERIEVTFTPTVQDYARATRWATRTALGQLYVLYMVATISIGVAGAFGFILLFDAALNNTDPQLSSQGFAGALMFIGVLYIGLLLKTVVKRFIARRTYVEDGFYLAQRTMTFAPEGITNASRHQTMTILWPNVLKTGEDKHNLYLQVEPGIALFIPKRIAASPEETQKLRAYAKKMRAESAPKV